jgi:hypothetical protein
MQHTGVRRYDYGLRINKSFAMEPRIFGMPPAERGGVLPVGHDPHHAHFVIRISTVAGIFFDRTTASMKSIEIIRCLVYVTALFLYVGYIW